VRGLQYSRGAFDSILAVSGANGPIGDGRVRHMGLHAPVSFLIRLISPFEFPLAVKHVHVLWHVPLLGLFSNPIPSTLPNAICNAVRNTKRGTIHHLYELRNPIGICLRPPDGSSSTTRASSILRLWSCPWRIQSRKLSDDLSIGPPRFLLQKYRAAGIRGHHEKRQIRDSSSSARL